MIIQDIENRIEVFILQTGDFYQGIEDMLKEEDFEDDNIENIIKQIEIRENILSTYNANNIIFPSAKLKEKSMKILIGISKNNILFNEFTIKIINLFLYSDYYTELYIDSLAYFKRLFMHKTMIEKTINSKEDFIKEIIIKGLNEIED